MIIILLQVLMMIDNHNNSSVKVANTKKNKHFNNSRLGLTNSN